MSMASDGAYSQGLKVHERRQKINVRLRQALSIITEHLLLGSRAIEGQPAPVRNSQEIMYLLVKPGEP
jgi:hypothetical protein